MYIKKYAIKIIQKYVIKIIQNTTITHQNYNQQAHSYPATEIIFQKMSPKEFQCTICDKTYCHKTSLMNHVHKKHTDNPAAAAQNVTTASQPASSVQKTKAPQPDAPAQHLTPVKNVTMAPKPEKCTVCAAKCSDSQVLKKTHDKGAQGFNWEKCDTCQKQDGVDNHI